MSKASLAHCNPMATGLHTSGKDPIPELGMDTLQAH